LTAKEFAIELRQEYVRRKRLRFYVIYECQRSQTVARFGGKNVTD